VESELNCIIISLIIYLQLTSTDDQCCPYVGMRPWIKTSLPGASIGWLAGKSRYVGAP